MKNEVGCGISSYPGSSNPLYAVEFEDYKIIRVIITDTDGSKKIFAPEKIEQWIVVNKNKKFECSGCRSRFKKEKKYCPNCGATMVDPKNYDELI